MGLDLDDISKLLTGSIPHMPVGKIVNQARHHLSQRTSVVLLSSVSTMHILQRHGDHLAPHDLSVIPTALLRGAWLADRDRCCQVVWHDRDTDQHFKLAVKAARHRREVFISTFHRTNEKQIMKYLRNGKLLRPQL